MKRYISRLLFSVVAAAFLLSLCGCNEEFREPLSNAETSEVDEQLLGTWHEIDDPDSEPPTSAPDTRMEIVKVPGTKAAVARYPREKGKGDPERSVRFFTTKIGERRFFSVSYNSILEKGEQKKPETFLVFAYDIQGATLKVFCLEDGVFGDAVVAGKLQGTAKRNRGLFRCLGPKYDTVTITDSPQHVREFLAANKNENVDNLPFWTYTREPPQGEKARPQSKPQAPVVGKKLRTTQPKKSSEKP